MKNIAFIVLLFTVLVTRGQDRLHTVTGTTSFEASIPLFEEINATNKKTAATLLTKSGQIIFSLYIKDFEFKRNLMREHFNSNYLESNRYRKAMFKGMIENFDFKIVKPIPTLYQIKGKIAIKGKTKDIAISATLQKSKNGIDFIAEFPLNTDDFDIEIPFMVKDKISKTVNTKVICFLK